MQPNTETGSVPGFCLLDCTFPKQTLPYKYFNEWICYYRLMEDSYLESTTAFPEKKKTQNSSSQSVAPKPTASAIIWELRNANSRVPSQTMESETLWVGPSIPWFDRPSRGFGVTLKLPCAIFFGPFKIRALTVLPSALTLSVSPSLLDHFHQHTYSCCYFSHCKANILFFK